MAPFGFLKSITISLIVAAFGVAANADPIYGVSSSGYISGDFIAEQTYGPPTASQVTSYASPVLATSGSQAYGSAVAYTWSATSWTSASDGSLHGYASTDMSETCSGCVSSQFQTVGSYSIDWYDTLSIGGLPSGAPVELLVTTALDSAIGTTASGIAVSPPGTLGTNSEASAQSNVTISGPDGLDQEISVENTGSNNGLNSQSMIIDTKAGAELQLISELDGFAGAYVDLEGASSATSDASDTANIYITVLTPGAEYTSASGTEYTEASSVPEPRSFWLYAVLLTVICATRRRILR